MASRWDRDVDGNLTATGLAEQAEWLADDNEKIVICDIKYYNTSPSIGDLEVGYFSNFPYITGLDADTTSGYDEFEDLLGDTVSNIAYEDILINIPNIISRIDRDINIGAIEFLNSDGTYDELITYAWEGHPLRLYIGGKDWLKNDFILFLEAISTVISSPRPNIMSLGIRDKREVFNVKAQTQLITDSYISDLYTNNSPAFSEPLDNLISASTAIEIKVNSNINRNDIAELTMLELNALPEFTASHTSYVITLEQNIQTQDYIPAHDGYDGTTKGTPDRNANYDTGFTFSLQGQTTAESGTTDQTITVESSFSSSDLVDSYFHIHSTFKDYYIWYNVDNTSVDPELIERVQENFDENTINIPDTILNTPVPICLGMCFNIQPKLIDANNHVYQVHEGAIVNIINVRSNGVVLTPPTGSVPQYEINKSIGCIRLLVHENNTEITCDVIGQPSRSTSADPTISIDLHSAAMMVEWLAIEKTSLDSSDICNIAFDKSNFTNTDPLGLYIPEEVQVGNLVTDIMSSVGGYARFHRTCVLQIFRFDDPIDGTPNLVLDESGIVEKGVSLTATEVPRSSINIGYDKNWTVQDKSGIAALITEDPTGTLLDLYTTEYKEAISINANIKDVYPLAEDMDRQGTLISDWYDGTANGQKEADRRRGIRSTKRYIYKVDSTVAPFTISIGDVITLIHRRFGFNFGKQCLVIGMEEKPTKQRVTLEVWL